MFLKTVTFKQDKRNRFPSSLTGMCLHVKAKWDRNYIFSNKFQDTSRSLILFKTHYYNYPCGTIPSLPSWAILCRKLKPFAFEELRKRSAKLEHGLTWSDFCSIYGKVLKRSQQWKLLVSYAMSSSEPIADISNFHGKPSVQFFCYSEISFLGKLKKENFPFTHITRALGNPSVILCRLH